MTDLETRVREGLDSEPGWRSPDDLLDDVRRGARRRRTRRTTGLVATVALVLAAAGGGVGWHHRQVQAAHATRALPPIGIASISVTGTGEIFTAVSNQGCVSPCSTIWRYDGGTWEKLAAMAGSGQSPVDEVIGRIVMAPDGRNGWAWNQHLYATHDGGTTWSRISGGPATRDHGVEDLVVGQTEAWVTSQTGATGRTLWHTPVGSDDWAQVQPPLVTMPAEGRVPPKHWFIDSVLPDGRVVLDLGPFPHGVYYTVGDEYGWTRQPARCTPIPPLLGGRVQDHKVCGPIAYEEGRGGSMPPPLRYSSVQVAEHSGTASAPVGDADVLYASQERAVIATHSGIVPSNLHLGEDWQVRESSDTGDHVAFFTAGGRVFLSNDNGLHWTQVK